MIRPLFLLPLLLLTQSASSEPRYLEVAPLTAEQKSSFMDSIRANQEFSLPVESRDQRVDPAISGFWAGTKTKVHTHLNEVTLRFKKLRPLDLPESAKVQSSGSEAPETFDISLTQGENAFYFKHSTPADARDVNGAKMTTQDNLVKGTRVPFIRGVGDTSVYLAISKFKDPKTNWGALVCPRTLVRTLIPKQKDRYELTAQPSPYVLSQFKVVPEARGEVELNTAGQTGFARVTILATRNLPPASEQVDEALSTVPRPTLVYKPLSVPDFFDVNGLSNTAAGISLEVFLRNKAGYTRKELFAESAYVEYVTEVPRVNLFLQGLKIEKDTGDCYIVAMIRSSWKEYGKE